MKLYRIKKSNIDKKGRGLYATKDIKEGTKIINYIGKLITKRTLEISKSFCNGNVVSILEGGYDLKALQESTKRHVDALIEFN